MSDYLFAFGIGIFLSFLFNFPPRKWQIIFLGGTIITAIISLAVVLDAGTPLGNDFGWINMAFNFVGYLVGYAIAKGARQILNVEW